MLLRNLLDRLWLPGDRARAVIALRHRLARERRAMARAGAEERAAATRLRALREELGRVQGALTSCAQCARDHPPPVGQWAGGECCAGATPDLFREVEVAALCLAGTRPSHLLAPRAPLAGCAFRGPSGCALPPSHRPTVCSRYLCTAARRELHARGDLARIEQLLEEVDQAFEELLHLRSERLLDEEIYGPSRLPMTGD